MVLCLLSQYDGWVSSSILLAADPPAPEPRGERRVRHGRCYHRMPNPKQLLQLIKVTEIGSLPSVFFRVLLVFFWVLSGAQHQKNTISYPLEPRRRRTSAPPCVHARELGSWVLDNR